MDRRSRLAAIATAASIALGAISFTAFAAPKDAAAKKLDQDAMNNDFLFANFADAEKKLKSAVDTCGASGCAPEVKARILVHMGIVQVNLGNRTEGEETFVQALALDANVTPEQDFTTPDVDKAFQAAKARAPAAGGTTPTPTAPVQPPSGDGEFQHDPPAEQMINTPVPIFVSTPTEVPISKVVVRYKPFGGQLKKLELRKMRGGYGGIIDCNDVTTTGDLKYYIQLFDAGGDLLSSLGSINQPFVTKIKRQLDGEPPRLPNEPPPAQCAAKEDCPPGLPGCPTGEERGDRGWGASCEKTQECQAGLVCKDGTCEEGSEEEGGGERPTGPRKRHWVGLYLSQDFSYLSGDDVCGRDSQTNEGYACFIQRGDYKDDQYHGEPLSSGSGNAIAGGLAPATTRILAGYDFVLLDNVTVGARVGYALGGGPQPDKGNAFLPIHAEARAAYWFGKDVFSKVGVRPFAFLGGGLAQVDTMVEVSVRENMEACADSDGNGLCEVTVGGKLQENPPTQKLDAWRKAGQSFVALGGGVMYALTPNGGIVAELKFSQLFPTSGTVLSPGIGYAMGF